MDARRSTGLVLSLASTLACGPPSFSASGETGQAGESSPEESSGGADATESETETGDTGEPEPEPPACEIVENDPALACVTDPCPVVRDLELRCPDDEWFAHAGADVAVGPDASWIFADTLIDHYMVEIGEAEPSWIDTAAVGPFDLSHVVTAVDPQGRLNIIDYDWPDFEAPSVVRTLRWEPPSFVVDSVANSLWGAKNIGFEFDDAGGLHVVHCNSCRYVPYTEYSRRPAGGEWTQQMLDHPTPWGYSLTIDGELFAYTSTLEDPDAMIWDVRSEVGESEAIVAAGLADGMGFMPIRKPTPATAVEVGPPHAAIALTEAGLRFVSPDGLLPALAETDPLEIDCPISHSLPCASPCEVTGVGLVGYNFAAVRTADGRTFLVWMENDWDLRFDYVANDDNSECTPVLGHDGSVATLHIDRFDFDAGALEPGAAMTLRRSNSTGRSSGQFGYSFGQLGAAAWGQRITVTMVEGGTTLDPDLSLRVFELDATSLP